MEDIRQFFLNNPVVVDEIRELDRNIKKKNN